jgi:hypothetical protein
MRRSIDFALMQWIVCGSIFCLGVEGVSAAQPLLTGAFGFTCDSSGSEINNERWDTVTTGRVWNLWFCEGTPLGTPNGLVTPFINGPSNNEAAINLSLLPGTNHYTFFAAANDTVLADHAINLFFNGRILPSISARAATWRTAAGALSFSDEHWTVTLTDYFWAHPTVFGVDRITGGFAGSTVPDGVSDFVGRLSLAVTRPAPRIAISAQHKCDDQLARVGSGLQSSSSRGSLAFSQLVLSNEPDRQFG